MTLQAKRLHPMDEAEDGHKLFVIAELESALLVERERMALFQHEILGIVGHDLRVPLDAIALSIEILAGGSTDEPTAAAVKRIVSFTKRMIRMVDQLLDLSRTRLGGGIPLARSPMRLVPVVTSVMEDLALAHPECRFELDASAEIKGSWDSDRIAQVVSSLLSNAAQFGLPGATIRVGVFQSIGAATISVYNELRDEPIPLEMLATLFDPYRRGWDGEHSGTGLGLGLYISHAIVRAHGGRITAESGPAGTTLRVVLPDATL